MVKNKTKYNAMLQKPKDESNKGVIKRINFFTESLRQINKANGSGNLEHYQIYF